METDLIITRGDSCALTLKKMSDGEQVDFENGESFIFSAKSKLKQPTYDIQSETFNVIDGEAIIYLTPEDTRIREGEYFYDIQYTDLNEGVYTIVKGNLTIDWDVTRDES
jgi:hypothetical protein